MIMSEKLEKNSNAKGVNLLDRTFRFNHTWNEICTKRTWQDIKTLTKWHINYHKNKVSMEFKMKNGYLLSKGKDFLGILTKYFYSA